MNYFIFWATFITFIVIIIYLSAKYDLLKDQSAGVPKPYSFARAQLTWWSLIVISSFITVFFITGRILTFDMSTLILLGISALTTASARMIDISDAANAPAVTQAAITTAVIANAAVNTAATAINNAASGAVPGAVKPAAVDTAAAATTTADVASAAAVLAANKAVINRNIKGQNFILDILSDKDGVSIHRLQAVIFNLVIGCWFLHQVFNQLAGLTAANALSLVTVLDPETHIALVNKDFLINQIIPVVTQRNLILLGLSSGIYTALKTTENK